jgi:hypothetical protein
MNVTGLLNAACDLVGSDQQVACQLRLVEQPVLM